MRGRSAHCSAAGQAGLKVSASPDQSITAATPPLHWPAAQRDFFKLELIHRTSGKGKKCDVEVQLLEKRNNITSLNKAKGKFP